MFTIIVKSVMDGNDYPTAGKILYREIKDQIGQTDKIVLDLTGITMLPSMFLNVSFGKFIEDYGMDRLKKTFIFRNITKGQANRLKEYLERYSEPVVMP